MPLTYAEPRGVNGFALLFLDVVVVSALFLLRVVGVKVERPAGRTTLTPAARSRHWCVVNDVRRVSA